MKVVLTEEESHFDEDTMERIQQYMNGQITTSTIANAMVTGNSMKSQ